MKIVVGLGNPGSPYEKTRHNIGWMVLDRIADRAGWAGKGRTRDAAAIAQGRFRGLDLMIVKPQTFMNDSGRSVGPARGSYKLDLDRILVVHDEIDLAFGDIRVKEGGGLAGHNGLKSLKRELGGAEFWRVRVGVGRPDTTDSDIVSGHVLGSWRQPKEEVRELIERARDEVERVVLEG